MHPTVQIHKSGDGMICRKDAAPIPPTPSTPPTTTTTNPTSITGVPWVSNTSRNKESRFHLKICTVLLEQPFTENVKCQGQTISTLMISRCSIALRQCRLCSLRLVLSCLGFSRSPIFNCLCYYRNAECMTTASKAANKDFGYPSQIRKSKRVAFGKFLICPSNVKRQSSNPAKPRPINVRVKHKLWYQFHGGSCPRHTDVPTSLPPFLPTASVRQQSRRVEFSNTDDLNMYDTSRPLLFLGRWPRAPSSMTRTSSPFILYVFLSTDRYYDALFTTVLCVHVCVCVVCVCVCFCERVS